MKIIRIYRYIPILLLKNIKKKRHLFNKTEKYKKIAISKNKNKNYYKRIKHKLSQIFNLINI